MDVFSFRTLQAFIKLQSLPFQDISVLQGNVPFCTIDNHCIKYSIIWAFIWSLPSRFCSKATMETPEKYVKSVQS